MPSSLKSAPSTWDPVAASFDVAFSAAPVGMALVDLNGRIERANQVLAALLGRPEHDLTGTAMADLVHAEDVGEQMVQIQRLLKGELSGTSLSQRLLVEDGAEEPSRVHVSIVRDDAGRPHHFVVQVAPLGERDRLLEQVRHESERDPLTGLPHRQAFASALAQHVDRGGRRAVTGALIVLDLDGFGEINDALGTAVGDEVLRSVGAVVAQRLRGGDRIARLDGDEFGILVTGADATAARAIADELLATISAHEFHVGHRTPVQVTASAGIALAGSGEAQDLFGAAEMALREAKAGHGGRAVVFDDALQARRQGLGRRRTWAQKLRHALATGGFVLDAQPVIAVSDGRIDHHELLLRMIDDDGSLVRPNAFLDVAERAGLMPAIDEWVIRQAVGLIVERRTGGDPVDLAVNVGRASLEDPQLLSSVLEVLAANPQAGPHLIFEITDRGEIGPTRRLMTRLSEFGCRFSLDDFGAGMASFAFLKHLRFDYIKLDGEFTRGLPESPTDQAIVSAVVDAARALGRTVIAECVEDEEILAAVARFGIDLAQGLRVGRPARASESLAAP